MWNAATAKRLDLWYNSAKGNVALEEEYKLFQHLVSRWPRRGYTLLDVGCGTGVFLEMLWTYGFDVTGFDNSTEALDLARNRLGNRAEFQLGNAEHLPFDDHFFDYAAVISVLEYVKHPQAILAEAVRVAERGLIIGFMNSWSSYYLAEGLPWPWLRRPTHRRLRWLNVWKVARMVRKLCPHCQITTRSVLLGSSCTWRTNSPFWRHYNAMQTSLPFGAYIGMRVDLQPQVPLTPLTLKVKTKALEVCTGLQPEASRGSASAAQRTSKALCTGGDSAPPSA